MPLNNLQHIVHQFDSYCKKVLKYYARNYYANKKWKNEHETALHSLSESELLVTDEYFKDTFRFSVLDYDIGVTDEALAEALANTSKLD